MSENKEKVAIIGGGRSGGKTLAAQIALLEELEAYRAIGTVEDIQKVLSFLGDENKRSIIDDLKLLNEYRALGTVEDIKKNRAKAIDDFLHNAETKICDRILQNQARLDFASGLSVANRILDEVAEQLKAGGIDGKVSRHR